MNGSLTDLSLSYCGLDKGAGKPLQLLLAFIDSKLETMNLQGNSLGTEGSLSLTARCHGDLQSTVNKQYPDRLEPV